MRLGLYYDLRNPGGARSWARVYASALDRIGWADRAGIGAIWVTEHHGFADGYLPAPLTFCAAIAVELTHAATLLHDDVLDDAEVRRGQDAARVRWGNSVSVLAGDFLLIQALAGICRAGVPAALPALLATIGEMIDAEAVQLGLRGQTGVTAGDYYRIIEGKTAERPFTVR